jgi:hypothetical protein
MMSNKRRPLGPKGIDEPSPTKSTAKSEQKESPDTVNDKHRGIHIKPLKKRA